METIIEKDAIKILKDYGIMQYQRGYSKGYEEGLLIGRNEPSQCSKSIKDCIDLAYKEGMDEANKQAQKNERQLELDIDRLKETIEILRSANAKLAKKIEQKESLNKGDDFSHHPQENTYAWKMP